MITDHQRQVLRDLEDRLSAEDPAFTRSFTALEDTTPPAPNRSADTTVIVTVIVTLLIGVPLLLAGSLIGALAIVVTPGLLRLVWHFAHASADDPDNRATARRTWPRPPTDRPDHTGDGSS
jgi:hypothetical protein